MPASVQVAGVSADAGSVPGRAESASANSDSAARRAFGLFAGVGPMGVLAALFLVTVAIGLFLSNTPTAVLVAPMAVEIGLKMGIPPQACAMTVAIACSAAFISPLGSPVNMIVREPGGYTFMDYARVGVPLVALSLAATLVLVRLIYLR